MISHVIPDFYAIWMNLQLINWITLSKSLCTNIFACAALLPCVNLVFSGDLFSDCTCEKDDPRVRWLDEHWRNVTISSRCGLLPLPIRSACHLIELIKPTQVKNHTCYERNNVSFPYLITERRYMWICFQVCSRSRHIIWPSLHDQNRVEKP
jgi:hypothetical protein